MNTFNWRQNRSARERAAFNRYFEAANLEPRLLPLLVQAMREQPTTSRFYENYKPHITRLAGWFAECVELRSESAYDDVYELIYSFCYDPPRENE